MVPIPFFGLGVRVKCTCECEEEKTTYQKRVKRWSRWEWDRNRSEGEHEQPRTYVQPSFFFPLPHELSAWGGRACRRFVPWTIYSESFWRSGESGLLPLVSCHPSLTPCFGLVWRGAPCWAVSCLLLTIANMACCCVWCGPQLAKLNIRSTLSSFSFQRTYYSTVDFCDYLVVILSMCSLAQSRSI
jgi:hypothetical protein